MYRQTMFAEFEMKSNQMAEAGESLNAENLCKLYYGLNQKYFGEDMVSDPQIAYEWARIPHFYYNFYVYQYATSFSAAVRSRTAFWRRAHRQWSATRSSSPADAPCLR